MSLRMNIQEMFEKQNDNFLRIDIEKVRKDLQVQGYAIVENFLTEELVDFFLRQFEAYFKFLGREFNMDESVEITADNGKPPYVLHSGMIQYLGHSQAQWDLRALCAIIFRKLFDKEDVISSFNGFCYMNGNRRYHMTDFDEFLHRDKYMFSNDSQNYAGFINLTTNDTIAKGGFVCIPGSHNLDFKTIMDIRPHNKEWYQFSNEEKKLLNDAGWKAKFIPINKGDFFLWDDRLAHCNTKCYEHGEKRCVVYMSMNPRPIFPDKETCKILKKRENAFKTRRNTGHQTLKHLRIFPKLPRFNPDKGLKDKIDIIHKLFIANKKHLALV